MEAFESDSIVKFVIALFSNNYLILVLQFFFNICTCFFRGHLCIKPIGHWINRGLLNPHAISISYSMQMGYRIIVAPIVSSSLSLSLWLQRAESRQALECSGSSITIFSKFKLGLSLMEI